jgi:superfamily II DNA/RNA helicase
MITGHRRPNNFFISNFQGRDFVGEAPSGMGKTVAYAIAVLQGIDMSVREPQAIILAPDHDVAVQIEKVYFMNFAK